MKIYIGGRWHNRGLLQFLELYLKSQIPGLIFVNTWLWETGDPESYSGRAIRDFKDLNEADLLIACYPVGEGVSAEGGFCIAKKIPVIYYIDFMNTPDLDELSHGMNGRFLPGGLLETWCEGTRDNEPEYGWIINNPDTLIEEIQNIKHKNKI